MTQLEYKYAIKYAIKYYFDKEFHYTMFVILIILYYSLLSLQG